MHPGPTTQPSAPAGTTRRMLILAPTVETARSIAARHRARHPLLTQRPILLVPSMGAPACQGLRLEAGDKVYLDAGANWGKVPRTDTTIAFWEAWNIVLETSEDHGELAEWESVR